MGVASTVGKTVLTSYAASFAAERTLSAMPGKNVDLSSVDVEIHIPTLNEENFIGDTLDTVTAQQPVQDGRVPVFVLDSHSDDATRQIVRNHTAKVKNVPRGKLNARMNGMKDSDADIVVFADAGDLYPKGWLQNLLAPLQDESVVAAHAPNFAQDPVWKAPIGLFNAVRPAFNFTASNSAVRRTSFFKAGGFRTDVDQFTRAEIFLEEEVFFYERLARIGTVKYVPSAAHMTSMRQNRFGLEKSADYHAQREQGKRF